MTKEIQVGTFHAPIKTSDNNNNKVVLVPDQPIYGG